ncbi:MAG: hypothetical protein VW258_14425, partial [Thalassolituus sp.]
MNVTYLSRCSLVFCLLILGYSSSHAGLEYLETPIYASQSSTSDGGTAIYAVDPTTSSTSSKTRPEAAPWFLL